MEEFASSEEIKVPPSYTYQDERGIREKISDRAEEDEVGSWPITEPTIGPASPLRPGKRSAKDVMRGLDPGEAGSLASRLCWKISPR